MPSTSKSYKSAQRRYAAFCVRFQIQEPFEDLLCRYVAFLAQQHLKYRTIKVYLSAIRCLQIQQGMGNPFADGAMPRLECVLTGVKRVESRTGVAPRKRLPITLDIMQHLQRMWVGDEPHDEGTMLWAAVCTGFFGFLRAAEFTVPSPSTYDPEVHLNLGDLGLDNHSNPSVIRIAIKQSETDPFRQGVHIFLGSTESVVCPVRAIIRYLGIRNSAPFPFHYQHRGASYKGIPGCKSAGGYSTGGAGRAYNGHSFRSGAATTAAQNGLEDSLIQTLGRWRSDAFKLKINNKIPQAQLSSVSRTLARSR